MSAAPLMPLPRFRITSKLVSFVKVANAVLMTKLLGTRAQKDAWGVDLLEPKWLE
eukprot:CAMPEP_0180571720 /NCGR_PEP_ID=MMETSP1037_2-20121125/8866_1 /TAXON_ID=632150 /ORGANISM="Azadinium spinosum, Strain 3D9" /LENGTH=54 /DNA_ID=CAMNT_0022589049 /DNA_START=59 /DNA_END=220 /DNA_ORIENTATION=-